MGFAAVSLGQLQGGHVPSRGAEPLTGGLAPYGVYATRDGKHVSLGALEPKFWLAFCAAAPFEADLTAPMPGPHQGPSKRDCAPSSPRGRATSGRPCRAGVDCCLEPVLEPGELREDAHLRARGMFFEMASPWGTIGQVATPLARDAPATTPPPRLGEHTREVLAEAGLSDAEIDALVRDGAAR